MHFARFFSGLFYGVFGGLIAAFGAFALLLVPLGIIGWVANIIQVVNTPGALSEASTWTILLALKVIGIVAAPIGAILGWVGIFA